MTPARSVTYPVGEIFLMSSAEAVYAPKTNTHEIQKSKSNERDRVMERWRNDPCDLWNRWSRRGENKHLDFQEKVQAKFDPQRS